MEHILPICSLESELHFINICSVRNPSRNRDIVEKPVQLIWNPFVLGTFGMCLLGVMIGIIASSQGLRSAFDNKVLSISFELEDDNQVIKKLSKT